MRDEPNKPVVNTACRNCKHPKADHTARAQQCNVKTHDSTHLTVACNCTEWLAPKPRRRVRLARYKKVVIGWQ